MFFFFPFRKIILFDPVSAFSGPSWVWRGFGGSLEGVRRESGTVKEKGSLIIGLQKDKDKDPGSSCQVLIGKLRCSYVNKRFSLLTPLQIKENSINRASQAAWLFISMTTLALPFDKSPFLWWRGKEKNLTAWLPSGTSGGWLISLPLTPLPFVSQLI